MEVGDEVVGNKIVFPTGCNANCVLQGSTKFKEETLARSAVVWVFFPLFTMTGHNLTDTI